ITFAITSTTGWARPSAPSARNARLAPQLPSVAQSSSVRSSPPTTTASAWPPSSEARRAASVTAPREFLLNAPSLWSTYTRMFTLRLLPVGAPDEIARHPAGRDHSASLHSSCEKLPFLEPGDDLL